MIRETKKDELDVAVEDFKQTFNAFKKAAKKLMTVMERIRKKRHQESESVSEEDQRIYEFLIQIRDDKGRNEEKRFNIKCVGEGQKNKI